MFQVGVAPFSVFGYFFGYFTFSGFPFTKEKYDLCNHMGKKSGVYLLKGNKLLKEKNLFEIYYGLIAITF
jgi:hypothetical protein